MSHAISIYTIWASVQGEDVAPWMLACHDEYSWEGDPDRCEAEFRQARKMAEEEGWDVREVTVKVDWDAVAAAFIAPEVAGSVEVDS